MAARTASANHILVESEAHCLELKAEMDAFIARRAPGAPKLVVDLLGKFSQLARDHSVCPSGVESGGALGEFEDGKMNRVFNDVVFNTGRVGTIEGPVKTDFGYHLILIIKRGDETLQGALAQAPPAAPEAMPPPTEPAPAPDADPLPPAVREYRAREAFNRGRKADPNQPTGKPFNWQEHQQKLREQEEAAQVAAAADAAARGRCAASVWPLSQPAARGARGGVCACPGSAGAHARGAVRRGRRRGKLRRPRRGGRRQVRHVAFAVAKSYCELRDRGPDRG
eukprot:Tamp_19720.p1 GENE.Tamp_19720~~Tamp_19720.p1  ORF type:complete len:299 (+),score=50.07 Tamp_19720:52-897(+)